tara:strand:+ start:4533 stop:4874 length:342 start_codon:yes stop_codon:yes gene_type:complete
MGYKNKNNKKKILTIKNSITISYEDELEYLIDNIDMYIEKDFGISYSNNVCDIQNIVGQTPSHKEQIFALKKILFINLTRKQLKDIKKSIDNTKEKKKFINIINELILIKPIK